jgi:hypothetical protein
MKAFFLVAAIIAFVTGLLLLVAPRLLVAIGRPLNQIFVVDDIILSKRLIFGSLLFILGILMIYTAVLMSS